MLQYQYPFQLTINKQVSCFLETNKPSLGPSFFHSPTSQNSSPYFQTLYSHLLFTSQSRAIWFLPLALYWNWQNIFQFLSYLISGLFGSDSYSFLEVDVSFANLSKCMASQFSSYTFIHRFRAWGPTVGSWPAHISF